MAMNIFVTEWFWDEDHQKRRYMVAYGERSGAARSRFFTVVGVEHAPRHYEILAGQNYRYRSPALEKLQEIKTMLECPCPEEPPLAWKRLGEGDAGWHQIVRDSLNIKWGA